MPPAQVPGSDAGSDNRLGQGTDLIPSFPAILPGVQGPKADTRLCPSAALQRGDSTDMPWLTHTTHSPFPEQWRRVGVPRYETAHSPHPVAIADMPCGGPGRYSPGLGTRGGSRASPTAGGSASTEGVWEELGSPLPAPVHLTSGLHFYEWAGGELIPVTMHSGTLTTNLI